MREPYKPIGINNFAGVDRELAELWEELARMGHEYFESIPRHTPKKELVGELEKALDHFLKTKGLLVRLQKREKQLEAVGEKKVDQLKADLDHVKAKKKGEVITTLQAKKTKKPSHHVDEVEFERQKVETVLEDRCASFAREEEEVYQIMGKLASRQNDIKREILAEMERLKTQCPALGAHLELIQHYQESLPSISDVKAFSHLIKAGEHEKPKSDALRKLVGKNKLLTQLIYVACKLEYREPSIKDKEKVVQEILPRIKDKNVYNDLLAEFTRLLKVINNAKGEKIIPSRLKMIDFVDEINADPSGAKEAKEKFRELFGNPIPEEPHSKEDSKTPRDGEAHTKG